MTFVGTTVYYALLKGNTPNATATNIWWRYGTLNPDGTITWAIPESSVYQNQGPFSYPPRIGVDTLGNIYIATGAGSENTVFRCPVGCPSHTAWAISLQQDLGSQANQFSALPGGKMVWQNQNAFGDILYTWSGASWDAVNNSHTGLIPGPVGGGTLTQGDCSTIHSTVVCAVPSFGFTPLIVYQIAKYNSTSHHTVWDNAAVTSIAFAGGTVNLGSTIATDNSKTLIAVYNNRLDSPATYLNCVASTDNGTTWSSPQRIFTGTAHSGPGLDMSAALHLSASGLADVAYENSTTAGYNGISYVGADTADCGAGTSVTVNTTPFEFPNALNVDGVTYTGPQSFSWSPGATHNITVTKTFTNPESDGYNYGNIEFLLNSTVHSFCTLKTACGIHVTLNDTSPLTITAHYIGINLTGSPKILPMGNSTTLTATATESLPQIPGPGFNVGPANVTTGLAQPNTSCFPIQQCLFHLAGLWWDFYVNGTSIVYRTSITGAQGTWSAESASIRTESQNNQLTASFCSDGTNLYYVYDDGEFGGGNTSGFFYRYGVPQPGGTITWTTAEGFQQTNHQFPDFGTCFATNPSNFFVNIDTFAGSNYFLESWRLTTGWANVFTSAPGLIINGDVMGTMVQVTSGYVLIYASEVGDVMNFVSSPDGVTWTSPAIAPLTDNVMFTASATSIGDTAYVAAIWAGGSGNQPELYACTYPCPSVSNHTIPGGITEQRVALSAGGGVLRAAAVINTTLEISSSSDGGATWSSFFTVPGSIPSDSATTFMTSIPYLDHGAMALTWVNTISGGNNLLQFVRTTSNESSFVGFTMGVWDLTNSTEISSGTCPITFGTTCSVSVTSNHPHSERFLAWIGNATGPDSVVNSSVITITWTTRPISSGNGRLRNRCRL